MTLGIDILRKFEQEQRQIHLPPLIQGRHSVYNADVRELGCILELHKEIKSLRKELNKLKAKQKAK